jgi:hypothetical protein
MIKPEFSRLVLRDSFGNEGVALDIEADDAERAQLALRFGLLTLDFLKASVEIKPIGRKGVVRVEGRLEASLSQASVVSLKPVPEEIKASFSRLYAPEEEVEKLAGEIDLAADESDPPDPFEGGGIDIGEAAAEELALALEPYPRTPEEKDKEFQHIEGDGEASVVTPFKVLERLKKKSDNPGP